MAGGCILDLKIEPVIVGEMCDLSDKGSECTDNPSKKLCVDCGTSKTPLWRGGPAGPKSLCNACGIRSRKKRRALLLELSKANDKKVKPEKKIKCVDTNDFNSSSSSSNGHSDSSCKDKLIAMLDVLNQRDVIVEELSEEQQAAVLLMAMSHGFNYD